MHDSRVTENVDEGRIYLQKQINIEEFKTPIQLKQAIQELEKQAIYEFVEIINANNVQHKYEVNIEEANDFVSELKTKLYAHIGVSVGPINMTKTQHLWVLQMELAQN